jgi:RNA polymerase sigma factor for flagellar operon FliA
MDIGEIRRNRQILAASKNHRCNHTSKSVETESVAPAESRPDVIREGEERREILAHSIAKLSVHQRQVIELYYGKSRTMKQIGRILQVSESRVSQIHSNALQAMAAQVHRQHG